VRYRFFIILVAVVAVCGVLFWVMWHSEETQRSESRGRETPATGSISPSATQPVKPPPLPRTPVRRTEISGIVQDTAGKPVPEAAVSITLDDSILQATTDLSFCTRESSSDGRFSLPVPQAGLALNLDAKCDGYRLASVLRDGEPFGTEVTVPAEGISGLVLVMERRGLIGGRVVDLKNRPVADIFVDWALVEAPNESQHMSNRPTEDDGKFTISDLEAGEYAIWARYSPLRKTYEWERFSSLGSSSNPLSVVSLREGEWKDNLTVVLPLDPARTIEGVVVDERGTPLSGAELWAIIPGAGGVGQMSSPTPDSGHFRVDHILLTVPLRPNVQIDKVTLCAACEGYEPLQMSNIPVGSRGLRLEMQRERRGRVEILLRDADSGDIIRNAKVSLWRTETAWGENRRNAEFYENHAKGAGTRRSWTGWFIIDDVPAGEAELFIESEAYGALQESGIQVRDGKTTKIELELRAAGLLCAHVEEEDYVEGWQVVPNGIRCGPAGRHERDDPLNIERGENELLKTDLQCGIGQSNKRYHRDWVLSPGEYDVQVSFILFPLTPGSQQDLHGVTCVRTIRAVVEPGLVTDVPIEIDMEGAEGTINVCLPAGLEQPVRLLLVRGEYDGFLKRAAIADALVRLDEYYDSTQDTPVHTIPFVVPGEYTVVCVPRNALHGEPWTQHVSVTAGETAEVHLE